MSQKMEDLGEWYQVVDIDGKLTPGAPGRGDVEKAWKNVKKLLPETLEGMRILDLGCNAGMYCVKSILMGAEEVVGIESQDFCFKQALFVKEYMEKKYNRKMNIRYINGRIEDHIKKISGFDIVYAFSILYYLPDNVCVDISNCTKNIIARFRDNRNELLKYSRIFGESGFRVYKHFKEKGIKNKHLIQFKRP